MVKCIKCCRRVKKNNRGSICWYSKVMNRIEDVDNSYVNAFILLYALWYWSSLLFLYK